MDIETWKKNLQPRLKNWRQRMQAAGINSIYAFLGASAVFPIAEAARGGDWAAVGTLAGVTAAGVGTNLLANVLQNWKDEADAAVQLQEAVEKDEGLKAEIDLLLEKLDVLAQAKNELSETDKTWFRQTLAAELEKLGNRNKFEAVLVGDGVVVQGDDNVVAGQGAIINQGILNIYLQYNRAGSVHAKGAAARKKYLSYFIMRTCEVLTSASLLSMEVGTSVMLDDIYIDLETKTPVDKKEGKPREESDLSDWLMEQESYTTALQAACQEPFMVLLGDPGSGKSTFVRRLAGWLAAAQLKEAEPPVGFNGSDLLPVLIQLRDLAARLDPAVLAAMSGDKRSRALEQAVAQQIKDDLETLGVKEFYGGLMEALQSGNCFLVLDGLDEVPEAKRACVRETVMILLQQRLSRVIVTCRIRSYNGEAVLPHFKDYILKPFNEEQIKKFINNWYVLQVRNRQLKEKEAEDKQNDLEEAALSPQLFELSSNPLLLTVMASLHTRFIGLPRQRVTLYRDTIDLLLERWQRNKSGDNIGGISVELKAFLENKKELWLAMEHLAYEAQRSGMNGNEAKGEAADLPRWRAREILERYVSANTALEFLDYADQRTGLLVGRGGEANKPGEYSFPHRTFQEYLAGRYLLRQRAENPATAFYAHATEGDLWDLAVQLAMEELSFNQLQDGILLDLAYQLCPNCDLSEAKNQRAGLWSGWAAVILGLPLIFRDTLRPDGGEVYLERLRSVLVQVLGGVLTPLERSEAGNSLASLGDLRFDPELFYLPKEDLLGFIHIPAGEFIMGSDPKQDKDAQKKEHPQHKLFLPEYYIARYPVTVAQYSVFVERTHYDKTNERYKNDPANHPVRYVTWYDDLAYCDWLERVLKDSPNLPETLKQRLSQGWKITLPGEAQWEKAARGTDGQLYPWGNEFDADKANTDETGIGTTSAIGCFPLGGSPYGVLDMSGNVFEWTRSIYKEYPYSLKDDREKLESDDTRVLRGGSFYSSSRGARGAFRGWGNPLYGYFYGGFRIILSPPVS